jgi:hypothetical protein
MMPVGENEEDALEIYYVHCPNRDSTDHWILFDPEGTLEPKLVRGVSVSVTICRFCGPDPDGQGEQVKPNAVLQSGWVTVEEQRQSWTIREPRSKQSTLK